MLPEIERPKSVAPRPPRPVAPKRRTSPLLIALSIVAVAALSSFIVWQVISQRRSAAQTMAPPEPTGNEAPAVPSAPSKPEPIDPSALFPNAKSRALAWNPDAVLVTIAAGPVLRGKVETQGGGSVRFEFAQPGEKLGPGQPVSRKRFLVVTDASGTNTREEQGPAGQRGVAEPACPLEEALSKAIAAGLPSGTTVSVEYQHSREFDRAVWEVVGMDDPHAHTDAGGKAAGKEAIIRVVDGYKCTILRRQR
jgi:hypothetical protein